MPAWIQHLIDQCEWLRPLASVVTNIVLATTALYGLWTLRKEAAKIKLAIRANYLLGFRSKLNGIFRAGLSIQTAQKKNLRYDAAGVCFAIDAVRNYFFDFAVVMFVGDAGAMEARLEEVVFEARRIAATGEMTALLAFRTEIDARLAKLK